MAKKSRREFMKTVGSVVVGGSALGLTGFVLNKNFQKDRLVLTSSGTQTGDENFVSPYKQIASFAAGDQIEAFEEYGGKLYVAASNTVTVTDSYGKVELRFAVNEGLIRDMAVDADGLYLLRPSAVDVYSLQGEHLRSWEACSEYAGYCSFTLAEDFVFVTDKDNKNICKYTREGLFVKFIESPNRFIIPSLTYGITYANGLLYCSNSGRHQIEIYTLDGDYQGTFGSAGSRAGLFCGCCNPVHITHTASGEIITSEKGNPRISCFGGDGAFHSLMLDNKALGGGTVAYEVKVSGSKLFVAGQDIITVFAYDETLAALSSTCAACGIDCGLKKA